MRWWAGSLRGALEAAGLEVVQATFADGEAHKTLATVGRLHRRAAQAGLHRDDVVVALGGGVVGDVAGFVAATYGRGIACVQVPTTLLGMVDAAIGGKTGVNLPEGKNLVGAFHQPVGVVADLDVLSTLPDRELRGGLAEVVKYSFIADPSLGELVCKRIGDVFERGAVLREVITRSVRIKAAVVKSDEREHGVRAHLNYGHTLGHAIEHLVTAGILEPAEGHAMHHGEAISVGMTWAAWVSVLLGIATEALVGEHVRRLGAVGLPTRVPELDWADVERFMRLDKKYGGGVRLVLVDEHTRPQVRGDISPEVLRAALERVSGA